MRRKSFIVVIFAVVVIIIVAVFAITGQMFEEHVTSYSYQPGSGKTVRESQLFLSNSFLVFLIIVCGIIVVSLLCFAIYRYVRYTKRNFDKVVILVPKGTKAYWEEYAKAQGRSLNAFASEAVDDKIKKG